MKLCSYFSTDCYKEHTYNHQCTKFFANLKIIYIYIGGCCLGDAHSSKLDMSQSQRWQIYSQIITGMGYFPDVTLVAAGCSYVPSQ